MRDDFAIFICTHGRPYKQLTLDSLLRSGYTGKYYLLLDDTDETIQQYIDTYGLDHILVFDKNYFINSSEVGTNDPSFKCILYAKNACEYIAKNLNLSAFVIADDDIQNMRFRWPDSDKLRSMPIINTMDAVIESYVDFMLNCDVVGLSFGPTLVYFSGVKAFTNECIQKFRIPFNFVFRNCKYPVDWVSSYGEDIVTAVLMGKIGQVWLALPFIQIDMVSPGEAESGGMSATYKEYRKQDLFGFKLVAFDFMYLPSSVKLILHKHRKWLCTIIRNNAFPKIVSSSYRRI